MNFFKKLFFQNNKIENDNFIPSEYKKTLFLRALNGNHIFKNSDDYPLYIKTECQIDDPIEFHNEMIKEGYLSKDISLLPNILSFYTVPHLKEILKALNLKISGKKDDLINRILDETTDSQKSKIINSFDGYVLSKKGTEFIEHHKICIEFHRHKKWDLNYADYLSKSKTNPALKDLYDYAWSVFNERIVNYSLNGDWGLTRNTHFYMYELLKKESKNSEAYQQLLVVLYYDLSGLQNNNTVYSLSSDLAPGICKLLYKDRFLYDESMVDNCYKHPLPFHFYGINEYKAILSEILKTGTNDISNFLQLCKKPNTRKKKDIFGYRIIGTNLFYLE